jgi:hypothetical protein
VSILCFTFFETVGSGIPNLDTQLGIPMASKVFQTFPQQLFRAAKASVRVPLAPVLASTGRGLAQCGATLLAAGGLYALTQSAHCDDGEMVLFSGNANVELSAEIAALVNAELGKITVSRFADGEVNVQVCTRKTTRWSYRLVCAFKTWQARYQIHPVSHHNLRKVGSHIAFLDLTRISLPFAGA